MTFINNEKPVHFICTRCGMCCKLIGQIKKSVEKYPVWMQEVINDFNEDIDENGVCVHLQEDNTCDIYDTRPLLCNIDAIYDKYHTYLYSRVEWYRQNTRHCNELIHLFGMDEKYLVDIKQYDKQLQEAALERARKKSQG